MRESHRPIGVIARYLGGYYFGGMLIGIQQVARKAGVPLICINQDLGDLQIPLFSSDTVAGWIVLHPFEHDRANLAALYAADKPVVMVPVPLEGLDCTLVHADNRAGMRDAVLHLIAHGHRRIAYVDHGPETWSQQRYLGYCDAWMRTRSPATPRLCFTPKSLLQTARAAMLLGAQVVMVGIRPEIAQSIVGLGIDLQHVRIESTLASAIQMLQIRRLSSCRA
jgi:DNA-binding LacI/PurR family transcriptional regulator